MPIIDGTNSPETLGGTAGDDVISGYGGNDILNGLGGNDVLYGGTGDDVHNGGIGNDIYFVDSSGDVVNEADGEGGDTIYTTASFTLLDSSWIERLSSANHALTIALSLTGNSHDNDVFGGNGIDTLSGAGGNDFLLGFGGGDTLNGGSGNDVVMGMDGDDTIDGGDGNDTLWGGAGTNSMTGGTGDDIYYVENSADTIVEGAGAGFDIAYVLASYTLADSVQVELLSSANHQLTTALTLTGNSSDNSVWGGQGIDTLSGGGGNDTLIGFGGADTLNGGLGMDLLLGGDGADIFAFTTALGSTNVDSISDFVSGIDKIFLSTAIFQGLPPGDLETRFFTGTFFDTSSAPAIYHNRTTGQLFYDSNGNAAGGETEFARVAPGTMLTKSDFVLSPNSAPIANPDTYSITKGSSGVTTPFKANDTDVDGQQLWVTRIGTDANTNVVVTRGLGQTSVTGIYGSLVGGAKSDDWGYSLNNSDPDTIAIAPGTTVTETFYYQITDGSSGSPDFTIYPNATYAVGVITIQITAPASSAPAIAPPAASESAGFDPGLVFAPDHGAAPANAWAGHIPAAMPESLDAMWVALA